MLDFWENFSSRLFTSGVVVKEGIDFLMAENVSLETTQDLSLVIELDRLLRTQGTGECHISGGTISGLSLSDISISDVSGESLLFTIKKNLNDTQLVFLPKMGCVAS